MSKHITLPQKLHALPARQDCSEDENARFAESYVDMLSQISQHTQSAMSIILSVQRTPQNITGGVVGFMLALDGWIESVIEMHTGRFPVPQCKPGCFSCCRMKVSALAPEVVTIAHYIKAMPGAQALIDRLTSSVSRLQYDNSHVNHEPYTLCPLLEHELCSVYPVRPFACRAWHSLDIQACGKAYESGKACMLVPLEGFSVLAADAVQVGIALAMHEAGIQMNPMKLLPALLVALNDEGLADRWASGEKVFNKALFEGPEPSWLR